MTADGEKLQRRENGPSAHQTFAVFFG